MKKIIGFIIILLMIPFVIIVIGDIDKTPIYPSIEFNIIDKPNDKQLLSNDKLIYQLPNTINNTTNELPEYVEYYEYGTLEVDSGILNYTVNDNLAYLNYIEGELTQVVEGEFIVSKPTQIISKSSNLFINQIYNKSTITIDVKLTNIEVGKDYTVSFETSNWNYRRSQLRFFDSSNNMINSTPYTSAKIHTFNVGINDYLVLLRIEFNDSRPTDEEFLTNSFIQLNEGTEVLPYEPYGEHIYNLDGDIELYKLPNGVSDRWLQNGTLEQNVGIIDTVNNYTEFGTLSLGTYDNILEFINDNQNIKLYYDDIIQESEYIIYLENDIIIVNNDTEFIRIYNNDTYTSINNLDTNITYKLEWYDIIDYTEGGFDDGIIRLFWAIPILLAGLLIYLLFKRKE